MEAYIDIWVEAYICVEAYVDISVEHQTILLCFSSISVVSVRRVQVLAHNDSVPLQICACRQQPVYHRVINQGPGKHFLKIGQ